MTNSYIYNLQLCNECERCWCWPWWQARSIGAKSKQSIVLRKHDGLVMRWRTPSFSGCIIRFGKSICVWIKQPLPQEHFFFLQYLRKNITQSGKCYTSASIIVINAQREINSAGVEQRRISENVKWWRNSKLAVFVKYSKAQEEFPIAKTCYGLT